MTDHVTRLRSSGPQIPRDLYWLESLITDYRTILLAEPFYEIVADATTSDDFYWTRHLLHHSTEFPEVLKLRRDLHWDHPNAPTDFYAQHVVEEIGHSDMLTRWIHHYVPIPQGESALAPVRTMATTACLAHAYMAAMTGTIAQNIVVLNVVVEAASFDFFNRTQPIVATLGLDDADNEYWRLHCEADEFHSADGLARIPVCAPDTPEGSALIRWAREAAIFWGAMLNSWVDVQRWPDIPVSLL